MSNILQPGQKAPDFFVKDQHGNLIKRTDFSSQWLILYFYPKDNTPGCTTEAQDFTHHSSEFSKLNAKIVGASPDTEMSHCKFIDKYNLSIQLLSDRDHQLAQSYGAWGLKKFMGKEYMGIIRSTFLIDPEGAIAYAWYNVRAKGHAEVVLKKLRELLSIA
ncbi:MAG: thioredoxin-dependent thiol peroxidase [Hydrococcus sp. Prado102]|jgi:peroxiredoxin Q/BCP|nr:thioredoxin-dependent thiol peroxidase [Hydrococcus sp. Prado102]